MMIFLMPYHLASPPNALFLGICHVRGTGKRGKSASNDYWDLKSLGGFHCAGSTHTIKKHWRFSRVSRSSQLPARPGPN